MRMTTMYHFFYEQSAFVFDDYFLLKLTCKNGMEVMETVDVCFILY